VLASLSPAMCEEDRAIELTIHLSFKLSRWCAEAKRGGEQPIFNKLFD